MNYKQNWLLWTILICFLACQKADLSNINNLRQDQIAIIGHGGLGFPSTEVNLPSNSISGIRKAIDNYLADGVEVDVQLSSDSVLFLYHDARLQSLTNCWGCIYEQESSSLRNCNYDIGFDSQISNAQNLIELEQIILHYENRTPKPLIFLDLKTSPNCANTFDISNFASLFVVALKNLFEKYNCEDWIILEAADLSFLQSLKSAVPNAKINYFAAIDTNSIAIAKANNFYGLSANFDTVDRTAVDAAHQEGLYVTLGILIIRKDAIDIINKSPDFIYTDNIPLLQAILN